MNSAQKRELYHKECLEKREQDIRSQTIDCINNDADIAEYIEQYKLVPEIRHFVKRDDMENYNRDRDKNQLMEIVNRLYCEHHISHLEMEQLEAAYLDAVHIRTIARAIYRGAVRTATNIVDRRPQWPRGSDAEL